MSCKRDYCFTLAKEDCRRSKNDQQSISQLIVDSETISEIAELAKVVRARAGKPGLTHLRTVDAWMRRAQGAKMTCLAYVVDSLLVGECETDVITVSDEPRVKVTDVSMVDTRTAISSIAPFKVASNVAPSEVASNIASKVAPTEVSVASKVASKVAPTEVSVAPPKAPSRVSVAPSNVVGDGARSSVSLSEVKLDPEDRVNTWYHTELSKLEEKFEENELRQEQFKRKRAVLRVEYWTRLDKIRNNATPTVIGA